MRIGHVDFPMDRIGEICRQYRIKELSVFGSALRDDFRSDSDVDLLVDFQPNHGLGLIAYLSCQDDLRETLGRPVDLVQKSGLKRFVKDEVLRTAKVVYAN